MDIHLCKEEKFVYGRNIKAPAQSHVIQSMSPFCKVASLVGLLLLLLLLHLQSVSLVGLLLLMLEILAETVTSIKISTTSGPKPTLILITGAFLL